MNTPMHPLKTIRRFAILLSLYLLTSAIPAMAQSTQLPAPTGHINDFAGVVDQASKDRLEGILRNLKQKTKVNFVVATVDSTGAQDISPFSRQLARDWNIILSYKTDKTILLVISVDSKLSIAQMTRGAQAEFPEGILGDLAYRMRLPLEAGKFTEALDNGVQFFLTTLAKRTGFTVEELSAEAESTPTVEPDTNKSTRPRVVKETAKTEVTPEVVPEPPVEKEVTPKTVKNDKPVKSTSSTKKPNDTKTTATAPKKNTAEQDADEAEEVELTLTLPLAKRADALKKFLETHPESKSRVRAKELLMSTNAGLADMQLKDGNTTVGVEQLLGLIDEADANITNELYSGVIAQIPTNLYMRGERAAAFQAATNVEKKFGSDAKRLLPLAAFYLSIERAEDALRLSETAVKLAPDLAEAHRTLALALHISLRLDEAAAEYKRTLELDPKSKASRDSLADLLRASGKFDEALALYEEQLTIDPKDKAAKAGQVITLLELGRKEEGATSLQTALTAEPLNLPLLTGVAYWYVAHQDYEKAYEYARKAIAIEPRYTWAQIALARALIGLKKPIDAERVMRYARQFGKFPTMNYELANVLASTGLYDEAVEVLRESFWISEGQLETKLAGRLLTRKPDFGELLATERKASIFQQTSADSQTSAQVMKGLLNFDAALGADKPDEQLAVATLQDFIAGTDNMRPHRLVYAANRLIKSGVGYSTALELLEDAKKSVDVALTVPMATMAVQAEEFRQLRGRAIAAGNVPAVAEAPQSVLANIMKGRIEDLSGWALFSQAKYTEAVSHLKRASEILPEGTPAWRNALWHLGVALEQTGQDKEALDYYIKSYNQGEKEPVRRTTIENLYKKINGTVDGLDDRIGAGALNGSPAPSSTTAEKPVEKTSTETEPAKTESSPATPTPTPASSVMTEEEALKAAAAAASAPKNLRVKISGRIVDADKNPLGNVVVVLISPLGSVISSTTDSDGNYSFTVAPSQKSYRLIPSKDGFSFSPIDKAFAMLLENQRDVDFVATRTP